MKGFFDTETIIKIKGKHSSTRRNISNKTKSNILSCESCGLYKDCLSPKMEPTGKGRKKILILAEVPGKTEDEMNTQLIGKSGQLLRNTLKELGYFLDRDFWKTNSINCRPPSNRTPKTKEINCCRHFLFEAIEKYNPKVIIPMGEIALNSLLGTRIKGRISNVKYSDWVGEIIPDQELKKYICPVYHPSYILRNEYDKVLVRKWKQELKNAIEAADRSLYIHNYESDIIVIKEINEAIEIINKYIKDRKEIVYDYETTGIKPHRQGHKIVSVSFSDGLVSYSFPFFGNEEFKEKWKRLISSSRSYCIAQNDRFEDTWNDTILGFKTGNWVWDTMIAQSLLNNRKNTSLKFWVYMRFGVLSYDEDVDAYIKKEQKGEDPKSDNRFNRIEEADLDKLLLYGGLDSLFEYKIYEIQKSKIDDHLKQGMDLFMDGFQKLLIAQQNGVRIDVEKMEKYERKIERKLKLLEEQIYNSDEVKKWDKEEKFNFKSTNDLRYFIYDCLGIRVRKKTDKGFASIDHSTLEKINIPITNLILEWRRWFKALNTYIMQYKREIVNGYIHPFFNLGIGIKSFRSSSSGPNLQNVVKRDKEVKDIIRDLIIPRKGNKLVEWDFKSMEVCFDKNTLVETIEGSKKIKYIVDNFDKENIYVYCYNTDKKRIGVSKVIDGMLTKKNAEVIEICLDNNKKIIVTENHEFMLRDGSYKKAKDLTIKDSLMPFYTYMRKTKYGVNYLNIKLNNGSKMDAHNLIAEDIYNKKIKGSNYIVHHKDKNGMNNKLDNLEIMNRRKHMSIHSIQGWNKYKKTGKRDFSYQKSKKGIEERRQGYRKWWDFLSDEEKKIFIDRAKKTRGSQKGKNNPMYGRKHSEETKRKISGTKKRQNLIGEKSPLFGRKFPKELVDKMRIRSRKENLSKETIEKMRKAQIGKKLSEEHKRKLSIAGKGRIVTEETRKKISKKIKEYWKRWRKKKEQNDNNHKILSIKKISNRDVYCLNVDKYHNFVLSAGIVVKNCTSAIYNKDPNLIKYINDDSTDMHRDMAAELFIKDINEIDKKERYVAKNQFVFAEFYGSYYEDTAKGLWENMPDYTKQHLGNEGINIYEQYEEHVKRIEERFWGERFKVYAEWKRQTYKEYERKGYIELLTGFRCYGPMKYNEVINYRIQGTAFHILLWTFNRVQEEMKKFKNSFLIGQIHDSILGDIHPDDEKEIDYYVWYYGTQKVKEYFDWINVPLKIEKESSDIDGSWANMYEEGFLKGER